ALRLVAPHVLVEATRVTGLSVAGEHHAARFWALIDRYGKRPLEVGPLTTGQPSATRRFSCRCEIGGGHKGGGLACRRTGTGGRSPPQTWTRSFSTFSMIASTADE